MPIRVGLVALVVLGLLTSAPPANAARQTDLGRKLAAARFRSEVDYQRARRKVIREVFKGKDPGDGTLLTWTQARATSYLTAALGDQLTISGVSGEYGSVVRSNLFALSAVPAPVLVRLRQAGCRIVVSDQTMAELAAAEDIPYNPNAPGAAQHGGAAFFVNRDLLVALRGAAPASTVHESGHAIQHVLGIPALGDGHMPDFAARAAARGQDVPAWWSDPEELWADAVRTYYLQGRAGLQAITDRAFAAFVHKQLSRIR